MKYVPIDSYPKWSAYFNAKIKRGKYCWVWQGGTSMGYGMFSIGRIMYQAHRVAYALEHNEGDIDGVVDHKCRNTVCVNPQHLRLLSHSENIKQGLSGRRGRKKFKATHCLHGHKYTPDNTYIYYHPNHAPTGKRECRACKEVNRRKPKALIYTPA